MNNSKNKISDEIDIKIEEMLDNCKRYNTDLIRRLSEEHTTVKYNGQYNGQEADK